MDFADATLVLLAEQLGALDVLTLDRRGFSAYRTRKGRRFASSLGVRQLVEALLRAPGRALCQALATRA